MYSTLNALSKGEVLLESSSSLDMFVTIVKCTCSQSKTETVRTC